MIALPSSRGKLVLSDRQAVPEDECEPALERDAVRPYFPLQGCRNLPVCTA